MENVANNPAGVRTPRGLAAVVATAAAGWIWFRVYTDIRLEDALITYRYARQLAVGHGFVFNTDERVLGTTTPVLTLALGLIGAIAGVDWIPLASNLLMMLAAAGAGVMTCLALEALGFGRGPAWLATAALLLNPEMLWMASGGMETPLVLFCMAASLWALAAKRHGAAAAFAGLLVLTRIDGVFWAAGVLGCILWQDRAALGRSLTLFGALLVPWFVFAFAYFGSPIPNSIMAKRAIGHDYDISSLPHLLEHLAWNGPFFAWPFPFARPLGYVAFATGAFSILRRRSPPAMRLLVVFPVAFSSALYFGRAPLGFDWYLAPIGYASLLVGAVGVRSVAGPIAFFARRRGWSRWPTAAAAVIIYVVLLGALGRQEALSRRDDQINEDGLRRAVGEWLKDNTPVSAVIAMEAVGYQAYYADRKVIDLAGLVSPAVVDIRRASRSNAEAFYRVLRDLRPDYLVLRAFEMDSNAHFHGGPLFESTGQMAYFGDHYEEVRRFEAPLRALWGEKCCLTVFRRLSEG